MVKIRVEEGDKVEVEGKDRYLYAEYLEPEGDNRIEVPKVRERLRVIPLEGKSIYEGVHPDWYDVLQNAGDQKRSQNEEKIGAYWRSCGRWWKKADLKQIKGSQHLQNRQGFHFVEMG